MQSQTFKEHGYSVVLYDSVGRQFDGLKGAEENERELSVPYFSLQLPDGSNSTVEEQLWLSIPQKAFSAEKPEIHVCFDIKVGCCLWTVWIRGSLGHQADIMIALLIVGNDQIHILIYTIVYVSTYTMIYHMVYTMVKSMIHCMTFVML